MIVVRILSIVFVVVGLALLGFAAPEYVRTREFVDHARTAPGKVIDVVPKTSRSRKGSASTSYHYRIGYTTDTGAAIEFINDEETASPEYAVGDTVPVLFDPVNPQRAAIDSFALRWFDFALLGVLAGFFLGSGLCNLWITAVPATRIRTVATLSELHHAWRSGRLTRRSPYQGFLVAFTFFGFALLGVTIMVMFFTSTTPKVIVGVLVAYGVFQAARGIRQRRGNDRRP